MQLQPISLGNLKLVGYDLPLQTLEINFQNDIIFEYYGLPKNIYGCLIVATSYGRYFHLCIRNRYWYKRMK